MNKVYKKIAIVKVGKFFVKVGKEANIKDKTVREFNVSVSKTELGETLISLM